MIDRPGKTGKKIRNVVQGTRSLILFLDQKVTSEKKSAIMIKGENYGKEI